jgi:hypothetical protein
VAAAAGKHSRGGALGLASTTGFHFLLLLVFSSASLILRPSVCEYDEMTDR